VLGVSRGGRWASDSSLQALDRCELVAWDVSRTDAIESAARDAIERFAPEAIYHLAAISVPGDCGGREPSDEAYRGNVLGTRRVLELAASLPSRPRVLVVSTSHVYAAPFTSVSLTEAAPLGPERGYGITKLAAEQEAARAVAAGMDIVVARAFQHTGPRQAPRMMLPEWARQFANPARPPVKVLRLNAFIDLSDVRDVVRAYRLLVAHGAAGGVYNVGSGQSLRSGDVLAELVRLADPARVIEEVDPAPKQDPIANIGRLVATTGWRPEIAWQQTVADTYDYWRGRMVGP
jgi:GDP-4-dehydro-6-deoxy-D-mannose reductase